MCGKFVEFNVEKWSGIESTYIYSETAVYIPREKHQCFHRARESDALHLSVARMISMGSAAAAAAMRASLYSIKTRAMLHQSVRSGSFILLYARCSANYGYKCKCLFMRLVASGDVYRCQRIIYARRRIRCALLRPEATHMAIYADKGDTGNYLIV